jgi:hypothetical protein
MQLAIEILESFVREGEGLHLLNHPNIFVWR